MTSNSCAAKIENSKPYRTFECVYQGGHHAVFCNGMAHFTAHGGIWSVEWPRDESPAGRLGSEFFKCDCEDYS